MRLTGPDRQRLLARLLTVALLATVALVFASPVAAVEAPSAPTPPVPPTVQGPAGPAGDVPSTTIMIAPDEGLSRTVTTVLLLALAATAPLLLLLMTTFTRFVVVFGLARTGLGLQTVPPAQVLVGLALFLTLFAMAPTASAVNEAALQPLLAGEIDAMEAARVGYEPLRVFMLANTDERDLQMFIGLSDQPAPAGPDEVAPTTLIPAFVISELRTAFTIGFVVFVPFLVIDLVVAAVLMSMGMVMLPPVFVSLPLKLLLFVLIDGWALLARSLVGSVA